jgi:ribose 5-phosphate isomerase A
MSNEAAARGIEAAAAAALELVGDGATLGLGTGRAASIFIGLLGARVRQGLRVSGVATSHESATLATGAGIPLVDLGEELELDLTIDGADEVAPNLDLVKGWGGALVRERIVAAASRRQVIIVGREKLVRRLGERGRIPVEVIPFARGLVFRRLKSLALVPSVRAAPDGAGPFQTENGHIILDCAPLAPLSNPQEARLLDAALRAIPGVVDTGLFLGTAERVLVGQSDGRVDVLLRSSLPDG